MTITLNTALLIASMGATGAVLAAEQVPNLSLEPCMNGGVSASGLYASQAEEDAALAEAERQSISAQASAKGR
jgi:hypothetical protein